LIDASLAAGDLDTAGNASAAAPDRLGNEVGDGWLRFARARLLIARGKLRDAAADLDDLAALDPGPLTAWSLPLWPERVRVRVAMGRHDDADEIARDGLARARAWGNPETVSRALRAVAATASDAARIEALGEAWDLTASAACPVERAQVGADLGAALRRVGRRADAANLLREALEVADGCGALAHVDTIRRELAALGARPRRSRRSGAGSLTPREHEIAELAAAGVMNDEIARSLHVTVKTVETHLTRAYRKLGVTGRGGLGAALR